MGSRAACAVLLIACVLMSCGQPRELEPEVSGSVFWPVPVARGNAFIAPFGDGLHAWLLARGTVSVIDRGGQRSFQADSLLPEGVQATALIRTPLSGKAWVLAEAAARSGSPRKSSVFLLDCRGGAPALRTPLEAEQLAQVRQQASEDLPFFSLYAALPSVDSEPRASLWVVSHEEGQGALVAIDTEGNLSSSIPLSALGDQDSRAVSGWQVVPVAGRFQAWLKAEGELFFVDARDGASLPRPLLRGERINWVAPLPDGQSAWVDATVGRPDGKGAWRQLFLVHADASARATPSPLPLGAEVRHVLRSADGTRLWVAAKVRPETGSRGGVYLVDTEGRSTGPLLPGEEVMLIVTRSGHVWLLTGSGDAHLADENGKLLISQKAVLPWAGTHPEALDELYPMPLGLEDSMVWVNGATAFQLRAVHGAIQVSQVLDSKRVSSMDTEPEGGGAWLQSDDEGSLYYVSLKPEDYLRTYFVVKAASDTNVFPAGDGKHGWIQAAPTSFAYLPLSEVGASLKLSGGWLEVKQGRHVTVHGRLDLRAPLRADEPSSVELEWPGMTHAEAAAGVLEVSVWDERHPEQPVASGTRRFGPGAPLPELQWHLDDAVIQEAHYKLVFRYHDQTGIDTSLVLRHVRFSALLTEQVWFRTGIACLVATLFFGLPLVFVPRSRSSRSWLPFTGWGLEVLTGSGLALTSLAQELRIHFPSFVAVLFAEALLGLLLGVFSPHVFRLLAGIKPFEWLTPLALAVPAMRRRLFADYVALTWRKLESQRAQANRERYVSLPADLHEGRAHREPPGPAVPPASSGPIASPEEHLCRVLTASSPEQRADVFIESPGGRGKSALLRETVRRVLLHFEKNPSGPLPVLCDASGDTLLEAAEQALSADPLVDELSKAMFARGDYVLVVDGLTESALSPDAVRSFIEGRYGRTVKLLCTSRSHDGFRHAIESSAHWVHVQPRRLDEQTLELFAAAYLPEGAPGLREDLRKACQGPDGTYLPILVRLALLFGGAPASNVSELYEAAFRGLLRKQGSGLSEAEDQQLLEWTGAFCLRTYWANGVRSLRYRNAPEREQLERLLSAGVLIPETPQVERGQLPPQVRFFHDSMQSYLTACGLFARDHAQPTWDVLFRAAADPLFTSAQSEIVSGAGSELFQMCLQVFGPEERLRRELERQLSSWSDAYDDALTKRDIAQAVPAELRGSFHQVLRDISARSPREVLRAATHLCSETGLPLLGAFYMRMAQHVWPLANGEREQGEGTEEGQAAHAELLT